MTKQDILDSLWVEKYRPKTIGDMALSEVYREKFAQYIDEGVIPNILFVGPPGSGKSAMCRILVNILDCEYEILNTSDDRGIDTVRGRIKNFARMSTDKKIKIMMLEEIDNMTYDAQKALLSLMEQYSKNTRFLGNCNYENKIDPALQSRFQTFYFTSYPKKEMLDILERILKEEKIGYDKKDLEKHIESYYPDLRKAINTMQLNVRSGKFTFQDKHDAYQQIFKAILAKDLKAIRTVLVSNAIDYTELYRFLYDNIGQFPEKSNKLQVLLDIAEYMWRDNNIPDSEVNFAACTINIFKSLPK
jgi:replication factor C small subunit